MKKIFTKEYIIKGNCIQLEMEIISNVQYKLYIIIDFNKYIISNGWLFDEEVLIGDIMLQDEEYERMQKTNNIFKYMNQDRYLKHTNKGYGSATLMCITEFAKQNSFNKIKGSLSDIDDDTVIDPTHRERQIYFYKKFGFKILPNEEAPQEIELTLK